MSIGGTVSLDAVDIGAIEREARRWRHSPARAAAAAAETAGGLLDAVDIGEIIDPESRLADLVRRRAPRFIPRPGA